MIDIIVHNHEEVYNDGLVDYVLSCIAKAGSIEKHTEWQKTQPVASHQNNIEFTKVGNMIVWKDACADTEYRDPDEEYPITATLTINNETIHHALSSHSSYLFIEAEDGSITALYVD